MEAKQLHIYYTNEVSQRHNHEITRLTSQLFRCFGAFSSQLER